jgi:hypothetical protein
MPYLDVVSLVLEIFRVARDLQEVYEVSKNFKHEIADMMRQLQGIRPCLEKIQSDHERGSFQDPPQLEALHNLHDTVKCAEQLVIRMTGEERGNVITKTASRIWNAKGNQQQVQEAATRIDRAVIVLTLAQGTNIGRDTDFAHMVSRTLEGLWFRVQGQLQAPRAPTRQRSRSL